jgi:alkanesulfonate monooxygenase SsuD/methylene tetrahydromethanopterin reductase-like flavin-dependent oxidoreductase (luciferase family)
MKFGYHNASFLYNGDPDGRSVADSLTARAEFAEAAGFDWYTLMDHFWQLGGLGNHDEPFVECYTGLSAIAAATERMRLSGLVTCVHYRNPAYLAKAMASLDHLSNGRGMLAIGAGWYEDEYDAIGIEFPPADVRIRQTRDVIDLCRAAWSAESPVSYEGEFFALDDLYLNPKPDDIPVMIGGGGEELTLRLTADRAAAWNVPGCDPDTYAHKVDVLRDHCTDLASTFEDIELTVTLGTCIRGSTDDAHDAYERLCRDTESGPPPRDEFRGAVGTATEVAELVETYRDIGVDTFQIRPLRNDRETTERFVDDVMPEFQ